MEATTGAVGEKHGRLTMVSRVGSSKHKRALWNCRCECGAEVVVCATTLRKRMPGKLACDRCRDVELIGGKFGRLTVLCTASKRFIRKNRGGRAG